MRRRTKPRDLHRNPSQRSQVSQHPGVGSDFLLPLKLSTPPTMLSANRVLQKASNWPKMVIMERRRMSWFESREEGPETEPCSILSSPSKESFVVCSRDGGRFVVPLAYLNTFIFWERLEIFWRGIRIAQRRPHRDALWCGSPGGSLLVAPGTGTSKGGMSDNLYHIRRPPLFWCLPSRRYPPTVICP